MVKRSLPGILILLTMLVSLPISAQTRMISHLTRAEGGFSTTVHIENSGATSQSYTLTPFSADGTALAQVTGEIAANALVSSLATELFTDTSAASFTIEADSSVHFSVSYKTKEGDSVPAHVRETGTQASIWRIFAGDWSIAFDGIAVVNTGSAATDVWVHQRNDAGAIIASRKIATGLAAHAKVLSVIGDPNTTDFDLAAGTVFEVTATQPLDMTALRGSLAAPLLLWSNTGAAMSASSSTRDDIGVFFIEHGTLDDVFEMMGYEVAVDRFWQLEFFRRTANGELAEILGDSLVFADQLNRTLGYSDQQLQTGWDSLPSEQKTIIQSYVSGINRRIAEVRSDSSLMPWEFSQYGLTEVRDWNWMDMLQWHGSLQRSFTPSSDPVLQLVLMSEINNLQARFGEEEGTKIWEDLNFTFDATAPTMLPAESDTAAKQSSVSLREGINWDGVNEFIQNYGNVKEDLNEIGALPKGGSFAWVIHGSKTATGNPMVYSGPQLEFGRNFRAPSFVMEASIRGGGLDVSGMTIPGIPGILIGRTPHHAWSLQSGNALTMDVYLESFDSITLDREEIIKVKDGADVASPVFVSNNGHGPVVLANPLMSWKYSHWERDFNLVGVTLDMARAESMESFGDAVSSMSVSLHITYADTNGDIAYWHTGREPVRPDGEWRLPQGMAGPALEWEDTDMPILHDVNNPQGFYGGWNQKSEPDFVDHESIFKWGPWNRATVITDWLEVNDNLSYEDVHNLGLYIGATHSRVGGEGNPYPILRDEFRAAVEANPTDERLAAIELLEGMEPQFVTGGQDAWVSGTDLSEPWMLSDRWMSAAVRMTMNDETQQDLASPSPIFGTNTIPFRFNVFLHALLDDTTVPTQHDWWSNASDSEAPQTKDEIIVAALDQVLAELGERPWGVGERWNTAFNHPLLGNLGDHLPEMNVLHLNRSNYSQNVEVGPNGPLRIESFFTIGQSQEILSDAEGNPVFNPLFTGMMPYFGTFTMRGFPLFD